MVTGGEEYAWELVWKEFDSVVAAVRGTIEGPAKVGRLRIALEVLKSKKNSEGGVSEKEELPRNWEKIWKEFCALEFTLPSGDTFTKAQSDRVRDALNEAFVMRGFKPTEPLAAKGENQQPWPDSLTVARVLNEFRLMREQKPSETKTDRYTDSISFWAFSAPHPWNMIFETWGEIPPISSHDETRTIESISRVKGICDSWLERVNQEAAKRKGAQQQGQTQPAKPKLPEFLFLSSNHSPFCPSCDYELVAVEYANPQVIQWRHAPESPARLKCELQDRVFTTERLKVRLIKP